MKVDGKSMRTIWLEPDGWSVGVIDQTALPHRLVTVRLTTLEDVAHAIRAMVIRGAPLIGATAAYGMCLALHADASDEALERAYATLAGDAADRDQSEMGARRNGGAVCATARAANAPRPPISAPAKSPKKTSRSTRPSARTACR